MYFVIRAVDKNLDCVTKQFSDIISQVYDQNFYWGGGGGVRLVSLAMMEVLGRMRSQ